jgi:hypothetical protein
MKCVVDRVSPTKKNIFARPVDEPWFAQVID